MRYVNLTPVWTHLSDEPRKKKTSFYIKVELACRICNEHVTVSSNSREIFPDRKRFPASGYTGYAFSAIVAPKEPRICGLCGDASGISDRDRDRLKVDLGKYVTDQWLDDRCALEPEVDPNESSDVETRLSDEGKTDLLAVARSKVPIDSLWHHHRRIGIKLRIIAVAIDDKTNEVYVVYAPENDLAQARSQPYTEFLARIETIAERQPQFIRIDQEV